MTDTTFDVVEGSGSGLDADTLDGVDSSALATTTALSAHVADTANPHAVTIDQLTPTTVKGDLLVEDGAAVVALSAGTDGQVLVADSTTSKGLAWASAPLYRIVGPAAVPRTGQVTCWDAAGTEIACAGTGQDGDLLAGVAWPSPRFTDNGDGTVTDELTGLIWLQDASCAALAGTDANGAGNWTTALSASAALASGTCGLTDGSSAGDWRLPNRFELESLLDLEFNDLALSDAAGTAQWTEGDAFSGVRSPGYWSSTSWAGNPANAWRVYLASSGNDVGSKTVTSFVWPVRGGQ